MSNEMKESNNTSQLSDNVQTITRRDSDISGQQGFLSAQPSLRYHFGPMFHAAQIKKFEDHYLDYSGLETLLFHLNGSLKDLNNNNQTSSSSSILQATKRQNRIIFFKALVKEITTVGGFYSERMEKYRRNYGNLWKNKNQTKSTNNNENKNDNTIVTSSSSLPLVVNDMHQIGYQTETESKESDKIKPITLKKVRAALNILNTLSLFWKLNENAILAIIAKYEQYSNETVCNTLLQLTDEEINIYLSQKESNSTENTNRAANNNSTEDNNIKNDQNTNQIISTTISNDKDFVTDGQQLLKSWKKWKLRSLQLQDQIEYLTDKISVIQNEIIKRHENDNNDDDNDDDDNEMNEFYTIDPIKTVSELPLEAIPLGAITKLWLEIVDDPLSPIKIPIIIAKGLTKGPLIGITCALHGNEVNGISLIHKLIKELDIEDLSGILITVPVLNPPGFLARQRYFNSGQDLNRCFPGKINGDRGQTFVYHLLHKLIKKFDYLIDLHTASHGRINSLYVRADMNNEIVKRMALLQNPEIIVHNTAPDGSARAAAMSLGIPAITVEIGNPSTFQEKYVFNALQGVRNVLSSFHIIHEPIVDLKLQIKICVKSKWCYVQHGGTLEILPKVNTWIKKGQIIAIVRNIFGDLIHKYIADTDGVVVGRNADPICQAGDRLLHIGYIGDGTFEKGPVNDGHA